MHRLQILYIKTKLVSIPSALNIHAFPFPFPFVSTDFDPGARWVLSLVGGFIAGSVQVSCFALAALRVTAGDAWEGTVF
jgi:hypothetical protein